MFNSHVTSNQMMCASKSVVAWAVVAVLCLVAAPVLAVDSGRSKQTQAELDQLFSRFGGFDGDPTIRGFREHGSNAVAYLSEKVKIHDSVVKRAAILVYTNLPLGLASRVRPPVSLTPEQIKAVGVLRQMGPGYTRLEAAVEALIVSLGDASEAVRSIAQGALGDIGPGASNAVPALVDCVQGPEPRINAIWALGRIGPPASSAVPALERLLSTGSGREKVYAAEALWRITPSHARAIGWLQNGLTDTNRQVRAEAAEALRAVGSQARDAVPALRLALPDSDPWARLCVARALLEVGSSDDGTIAVLMEAVTNHNSAQGIRGVMAAQSLLKLKPTPAEAVELLKNELAAKDERRRLAAATVMAGNGLEIPAVLSTLTEILDSSTDYRILVNATKAAGVIGPPARSLCPVFRKLASSKDEELRNTATEALMLVQVMPSASKSQ